MLVGTRSVKSWRCVWTPRADDAADDGEEKRKAKEERKIL